MQRLLATLLLAVFSFTLTPSVWFGNAEAKLPPCCRRDGKHSCGMKMQKAPASSGVALRATAQCPLFGKGTVTPATAKGELPVERVAVVASLVSHPRAIAQTEARYSVSHSRSRQKRGPPAPLS